MLGSRQNKSGVLRLLVDISEYNLMHTSGDLKSWYALY